MKTMHYPQPRHRDILKKSPISVDKVLYFTRSSSYPLEKEGHSSHHRYLIVYCEKGKGEANIDYDQYILNEKQFFIIFPYQFQRFQRENPQNTTWYFFTFELDSKADILPLKNKSIEETRQYLELLHQFINAFNDKEANQAAHLLEILLVSFLANDSNILETKRNLSSDSLFAKVNKFIQDNEDTPFTTKELCSQIGISYSHTRKLFLELYSISLGRYIREQRLNRAISLIQNGKLQMTEIALRSGYESLSAFSIAFKKTYGVSPTQYIKR